MAGLLLSAKVKDAIGLESILIKKEIEPQVLYLQ